MDNEIKAIIFDMDGVIIDTEQLWKRAEHKVFSAMGVNVSPELSELTESMTTAEVTEFWYERQPWKNKTLKEVENEVIDYVNLMIELEGVEIKGIREILLEIKNRSYKIGLATNSPCKLIPVVLKKLNLEDFFDAFVSAENEIKGKPDPSIYLSVAKGLKISPESCLVFEDSYSGLMAARSAGMKTLAIIPEDKLGDSRFEIADIKICNYSQFDISLII
ncbi:MAG: hexitol phosphatase HxpB [Bacteroidales bacterium]|nr:hexitol phosphatase HxpB [Bacteroidales bacterium]